MWRNGDIAMGPSADHPIVKELTDVFKSKLILILIEYYNYSVVIFKNN